MPFARVARSAAPASAGRNDVRRNTSVRTVPTASTNASVRYTRPNVSQPSLPGGAPCSQLVWMYSRPKKLPTRNSTNEIGTHDASASATWRIGPVQRASMITNAHARQSAACAMMPK